jgi:predicted N-formylglutamate amidohydrolase
MTIPGFGKALCTLRAVTTPRAKPLHPPALLGPDDPAPFVVLGEQGTAHALIVCDHASRAIPRALQGLGLPELPTWQHIAWDIGAGELARGLAHALDAPAVLAGYSRLVVDCNRNPDDADWCRVESDGWTIPGNQGLDAEARRHRLGAIFEPYHGAIEAMLHGFQIRGIEPLLISIHSFAPRLGRDGAERPWHVGVLWDRDEFHARRLLARLRAQPGLVVGDNEPYSGKHPANYTIDRHAKASGLPHVCLEVRQDLLESPAGVERWVRLLARVLGDMLPGASVRDQDTEIAPRAPSTPDGDRTTTTTLEA